MAINNYLIKHASITDIGLIRNLNEDSIGFIEVNDGYVFIVCDGMGGHEGGEIASKAAVRFIIESLNAHTIENPSIALHQAIAFANQQIFLTAQNRPELKGMGTTVAILLIYKDEIFTAHVGDSRIYVLTDNNFFPITKDHSVVQEMLDKGILQSSEAENHPRKNEITKALGIKEEVAPTISSKALKAKAGDRFIICTDGLSGLISSAVFNNAVIEYKIPDTCAKELVNLAKKGGGHDNISVQVVDITQSPFTNSFYPSQPVSLPVAKKKMKKSLILTMLFGGLILLGGIGVGVGKLVNTLLVSNDTTGNKVAEQTNEKVSNNSYDSLDLIKKHYIQKADAIDSLKKYLKSNEFKNKYIALLESSSEKDIESLIKKNILELYDNTYKLYKLNERVLKEATLTEINKMKDSLINIGFITQDKAIKEIEKFIKEEKSNIDLNGYVKNIKSNSDTAVNYLIEMKVLADYNRIYKLYKLHDKITHKN